MLTATVIAAMRRRVVKIINTPSVVDMTVLAAVGITVRRTTQTAAEIIG